MIYFNNNFYERKCILDRIIDQIEEKVEKYMNNYIDLKPVSELLGMSFFMKGNQKNTKRKIKRLTLKQNQTLLTLPFQHYLEFFQSLWNTMFHQYLKI